MAKFKYQFESILRIKETLEKKIQKEISLIDLEIDNLNKVLQDMLEERNVTKKNVGARRNIKASELQFYNEVEILMDAQMKKISGEINRLEEKKKVKVEELIAKSKEHKIFETLEGKHLEDFVFDQNQIEQKEIDEIAMKKFAREG